MASSFVEQMANNGTAAGEGYSIAPGVVMDNLNLLLEGKVQVQIDLPQIREGVPSTMRPCRSSRPPGPYPAPPDIG